MIFVTLGTQDKPFVRLLQYLEDADIDEEIVCQCGFTPFVSKKMKIYGYLPKDEFESYLDRADVVIAHGGVGSIISAVDRGKKVIVCARLARYGEHQNDHQMQIVKIFKDGGYVLELNEDNMIEDLLKEIVSFESKPFAHNNANFVSKMRDFIGI